jgi:hypothetical protein
LSLRYRTTGSGEDDGLPAVVVAAERGGELEEGQRDVVDGGEGGRVDPE